MKYAIQVNAAPYESQACENAYQFIKAALRRGHEIVRVFFYHDGVYNALNSASPDSETPTPLAHWPALAKEHGIDLVACVTALQKRGVSNPSEAEPMDTAGTRVAGCFRVAGLGLWVDACLKADRVVVFG